MKPFRFDAIGLIAVALFPGGCTAASTPAQPTRTEVAPAALTFLLKGSVTDTAYRSLSGAIVEVIDGPGAGSVATVDAHGYFSMPGTFTGTVRVRASKDGYATQTQAVAPVLRPGRPVTGQIERWVAFYLESPEAPINIAGQYSLSLIVDSACTGWPAAAQSRHYTATIIPNSRTNFRARLDGARFYAGLSCPGAPPDVCTGYRVGIGVAGDYASIFVNMIEQLSERAYLIVEAGGAGPWAAGITTPLNGYLEYCSAEPVLIDQGDWTCPAGGAIAACESTNHRLALVPR